MQAAVRINHRKFLDTMFTEQLLACIQITARSNCHQPIPLCHHILHSHAVICLKADITVGNDTANHSIGIQYGEA